jgi:hypothetical protein
MPAPYQLTEYELKVFHHPEGWRRFALLPGTVGFRLVCIVAEEAAQAWIAPIRVERHGEVVLDLPAQALQAVG